MPRARSCADPEMLADTPRGTTPIWAAFDGHDREFPIRILAGDGQPPQQYRCNGPLANFAPFQQAFAVKPGDAM